MNYLRAQQASLEKQIEQNQQMIEVEKQKEALGANADQDVKPNPRFKHFNDIFSGLTKSKNVGTMYPIVSCMITYNSKSAVTVTKRNDMTYFVKMYNLESYLMTFEEQIGGKADDYIKLKEVEQNSNGTKFAISYMNDGVFFLRTFGETTRSKEEIEANEFNINEALGLNAYTMPINNFPDPFITCCYCGDEFIYVNLFHNHTLTHHHFFFHIETREIHGHTEIYKEFEESN